MALSSLRLVPGTPLDLYHTGEKRRWSHLFVSSIGNTIMLEGGDIRNWNGRDGDRLVMEVPTDQGLRYLPVVVWREGNCLQALPRADALPAERRAFRRVQVGREVSYALYAGDYLPAYLADLSPGGARLLTDLRPRPNWRLNLRLPLSQGEVTVTGRVVHVRPNGSQHSCGLQFLGLDHGTRTALVSYWAGRTPESDPASAEKSKDPRITREPLSAGVRFRKSWRTDILPSLRPGSCHST